MPGRMAVSGLQQLNLSAINAAGFGSAEQGLLQLTETLSCSRLWMDRDKRCRYVELHHASPLKIFAVLNIEGTVRRRHSNVLELGDMCKVTLSLPNPSPCPLCVLKQANHAPGRAYFQVRKDCVLQFCLLTY